MSMKVRDLVGLDRVLAESRPARARASEPSAPDKPFVEIRQAGLVFHGTDASDTLIQDRKLV